METNKIIRTSIIVVLSIAITAAIVLSLLIFFERKFGLSTNFVEDAAPARKFAEQLVVIIVGIIEIVKHIQEGGKSQIIVKEPIGPTFLGSTSFSFLINQANEMVASAKKEHPTGAIVEAELFVLRDRSGKTRAILGSINEAALLTMVGRDGKPQAILAAEDDGTLMMADQSGTPRLVMGYERSHDTGTLQLVDKNAVPRVSLMEGALLFKDDNKKPRIHLTTSDDRSILSLHDKEAKGYVMLVADDTSKQIAAQQDKSLVAMSVSSDKAPILGMLDQNGQPIANK